MIRDSDSESLRSQVCKLLDKDAMLRPKALCEVMNLTYNERSAKTLTTYKSYWKALHNVKTDYGEEYRARRNLQKLTLVEAAYIAGIIDGEGCLTIHSKPSISLKKARSGRHFDIRLQIVNTNEPLMQWLCSKIGGYIYGKAKRLPNEKPIFRLTLYSNGCRWLLPQIKPFLIVKEQECSLILQALGVIETGKTQQHDHIRSLQLQIWHLHGGRWKHK
jgi:hypothetical protein